MNTYYIGGMPVTDELYHHGILGQKWGVRRYQNPDGTLTPAGKKRYTKKSDKYMKRSEAELKRLAKVDKEITNLKELEKNNVAQWNEYESERLKSTIKANDIRKRNDFLSNNLGISVDDEKPKRYDDRARKFIEKQMEVEKTLADIRAQLPYYESVASDLVKKSLNDKMRSHEYLMLAEKGITRRKYENDTRSIDQVPDKKLKRQNNKVVNKYDDDQKEAKATKSFLNEVRKEDDGRGVPITKAKSLGEKYIKEMAKLRLEAMGYNPTQENINNLAKKDWFRNSTLLSNTLASIGVEGVNHTSRDDMRSGKQIKFY
jgi:hypothetical protein